MKARKLSAGIWAVAMLLSGLGMLGFLSVPVVAPPNMHYFSGSITYNGLDAPTGTEVFAEIDGTVYGQDSVYGGTGGYVGSAYGLTVAGEDAANFTAKEGGVNGDTIIFWVLVPGQPQPYIANQAPAYTDGAVDTLNLVVQSATQPVMVKLNQISHWNTSGPSDWVQLYNPSAGSNVDLMQGWSIEDNYGGLWTFGAGDILPPLGYSPVPHNVNLLNTDGNVKLVWSDPLGTIAGGNPVVMDKAEWGPHLGDSEASGGDTIGLDKGAGSSVWDPNLGDCGAPDIGYTRIDPNVDTDKDTDWICGTGLPEKPQLWPLGTLGYETDYLDPETGDPGTNFAWQVWYAHNSNTAPTAVNLNIYYQATSTPIVGSPFPMSFSSWKGAPNDYVYSLGGAIYAFTGSGYAADVYCYNISASDGTYSNKTADFCFTVGDATPPDINNVLINGTASKLVQAGEDILITASIDDTSTGGSLIGGAEWSLNCTAPWLPMYPTDGAYDEITEAVNTTFNTAGLDGPYTIAIRAWDVVPNMNDLCLNTATLTVSTGGDNAAPNVYAPRVNNQWMLNVTPGTPVQFTAIIDDSATGGSVIGGANWSVFTTVVGNMLPMDILDSDNETMYVDIDTTGMSDGSMLLCVHDAWDVVPNYGLAPYPGACAGLTIDGTAPAIGGLSLNGVLGPITVMDGEDVYINATVDDTLSGGLPINNASFTIDGGSNTPMTAADGNFDGMVEDVEGVLNTAGMGASGGATYNICVSGADILMNTRINGACRQLTVDVLDTDAPVVSNILLNSQATLTVTPGTAVTVTADIDDSGTGNSAIAGANYTVGIAAWPGTDMDPSDGGFDSAFETATKSIDTTGWADATYDICVYGWDAASNYNTTGDCTQLTVYTPPVLDNQPPEILTPQANPATFQWGTVSSVTLTATIDDTNTGGYNITSANYTVGQAQWPGTPMNAVNAPFDSVSEDVTVGIDVSTWDNGTYNIYIYATDQWGNANTTGAMVTITIQATPVDDTNPTIGTPQVTPDEPKVDDRVTITVTVTDDTSTSDNIDVTVTITDPDGTAIVTSAAMTYSSGTFTYQSPSLTKSGDYTYTITAEDEAGNSVTSQVYTIEVKKVSGQGVDWLLWLLLIIIIIVIIIIIAWALTRKKPEEEIPPEAPMEEELPPEEEMVEEEAVVEEEPVEEVFEEPAEEIVEEPAPMEEAPTEEAPMEEAPAGPITCPNCGTVNPAGISVCTSCGSPL